VEARATSIEDELGRPVDRGPVLAECLASLWTRYSELRSGRASNVLQAWRAFAEHTFGRRVECWAEEGVVAGTAEGIDDAGALVVRTAIGVTRVISGQVKWD
jgi:BirA family biotin operon repressor/biotin-[acetyl-CoA-carboxylase] ligase